MTVRTATTADHDSIGALTVAVYVGEGYISPESPYADELADTARRAGSATLLVAEHDGEVVGSLTVARPGTPYADIARPGELEFRMLAVSSGARGLGAGTALVRTVIELARIEAFDAVVLTTMPAMADARRLYDRLGFTHAPQRDWVTPSGLRLTVMRLPLDSASG
ncbi:GNAT family N-acetyltransferase [Nocardia shimofusensis]|uniref:GNAT family N-acetyltransferase n=1 Tax=Nocardia shimofusensis TaxID=228596 RepID=UPI00082D79FC|nr:GNAT family N-acetyltransferase [Nocardia shimofusensis]